MVHKSLSREFLTLVRDLAAADDASESEALCAAIVKFPDFEDRLLEAICDSPNETKRHVALAIGALGASASGAFRGVVALLSDEDEAVSAAASTAIERLGPLVEPCVVRTMQCEYPDLRAAAAKAVQCLNQRDTLVSALWCLLRDYDFPRFDAVDGLKALGCPARNVILALLGHSHWCDDLSEWFAEGAVSEICVAAMEDLAKLANDQECKQWIRAKAITLCATVLGETKLADTLSFVADNDPSLDIRQYALVNLMRLGREAVKVLTQVIESSANLPPPADPELRVNFEVYREEVRAGLEALVFRPLRLTPFAGVRRREPKRVVAEASKSLLALTEVCIEWKASTFSLRSLVKPLASKRSDYGLEPLEVSIATIKTHLESLARQCGLDSLIVVTPGRPSRFKEGALDSLKALRPRLEKSKRLREEEEMRRQDA